MGYSDLKELLIDSKNLATGANDLQLKSNLLDIQGLVFDLQEENRELRNNLNDLKNENLLGLDLEYMNGVYRSLSNSKDIYCSVCWDRDKNLSRVRKVRQNDLGKTDFSCEVCKAWRLSNIPWEEV